MNRLDARFAALKASNKRAFVAYIAAGDPSLEKTVEIVRALDAAGADVIELGLPFSDPLADGIVNQLAADRAIRGGTTTPKVLEMIKTIRLHTQVPIVLFTYLNPIYTYGYGRFHHDAAAAGADGVLVLDLPHDEADQNAELKPCPDLAHIRLIAPTTAPERVPVVASRAEGFIYYVSREGVTGAQTTIATGIGEMVASIKAATNVPVCVGFGISTPEQAATVAAMADGVVVGSAIVKLIEKHGAEPDVAAKVGALVKPMVDAVKSL